MLNWDDAVCRKAAGEIKSRVFPFSVRSELSYGMYVSPPFGTGEDADSMIVYRDHDARSIPLLPSGSWASPASTTWRMRSPPAVWRSFPACGRTLLPGY